MRMELEGLLSPLGEELSSVLSTRGANDRVDALTLLCRSVLRSSSLCIMGGGMRCFGGRVYSEVRKSDVCSVLGNLLVDSGVSPTDVRKMGDMPLSVVVERVLEPDRSLIAFTNGVYRMDGGEFTGGFSKEFRVTESLPYPFVPDARCPLWESFLGEVMPDSRMRSVLQEFFGMVYLDRGALAVEKFALFVGSGANGKSVVFEVIRRALGPDNVSTLDASQLTDEKMIPVLNGKRLNFAPDMAKGKDFSSALKALASGQTVTGRAVFRDAEPVTAPPLCFALNEMPLFRDVTPAFFRRMLLFPFDVTIPEERQDRTLSDRISASDLPGVFLWMMEGRRRLIADGGRFSPCPKMDSAISLLRNDVGGSDHPVRTFLEERGFSLRPVYEGQAYTLISQNEIDLGLRHSVSRYSITAELRGYGVKTLRSKELFYKVYLKTRP